MLTLATVPTGALDGSPIDESRPHPDWLRASGGLDAPVIEQFENRAGSLAEAHTKHCLVIDLAGVSSLDTTALGALMRIVARSRRGARPLIIVPPDREAAPPMYVSGVDRQLPLVGSRAEAESVACDLEGSWRGQVSDAA